MKKAVVTLGVLLLIFGALLFHQLGNSRAGTHSEEDTSDTGYEYYEEKDDPEETSVGKDKDASKKLIKVDTKPDSITVLVNKKYKMSKDYIPADLVVPNIPFSFYGTFEKSYVREVTARALEKLFAKAATKNIILKGVSGYRSYARQEEIYNRNVNTRGKETTNLVSASPGSSEHQTGLTIDVSSESVGCALETSFGDTAEGKWLARNCHKYGFIIRYPEDKTEITGYSYEPWHIRYVGKKLATYLYKKNLTLEEYYQTTTVDQKIVEPEESIHDMDDDKVKEPEMTSAPTPKPTVKARVTPTPETTPSATPDKTKKPKQTKKPKATKKPVKTPKPKPTKKPAEATPEATQAPEPAETQPAQDGTEDENTTTQEQVE